MNSRCDTRREFVIHYHGRLLTIVWDKTGQRFGKGPGLRLLANGEIIASSKTLKELPVRFPAERSLH